MATVRDRQPPHLAGTPTTGAADPAIILPLLDKRALSRLRHYFERRHYHRELQGDGQDLVLLHHGLLGRYEHQGYAHHAVTDLGERVLGLAREAEIARRRPHNDLANRLATWLVSEQHRTVWLNVEFRIDRTVEGYRKREAMRPDIFSLVASYEETRIRPVVHEVKVSRADFQAELANAEKRELYTAHRRPRLFRHAGRYGRDRRAPARSRTHRGT